MSINSREDLNKYYTLINELVDNYIEKHKIRPSRLINYLSPGSDRFNRFLSKNGLSEVLGSETILKDILHDRAGMEEDGVYTFESHKYFESTEFKISNMKECLYKGIEKSNLKSEKIIADYFDVNLGDIDIIDSEKHSYRVNDWHNDDWTVVIYSEEDITVIQENLYDYIFDELCKSKVSLSSGLEISLEDLIVSDAYKSKIQKILSDEKTLDLITSILGSEYKYLDVIKGFHLWTR